MNHAAEITPIRLPGIQYSDNPEAYAVASRLHLKYPVKPFKVELHQENQKALQKAVREHPIRNRDLRGIAEIPALGEYHQRTHTIFVAPKTDPITSYHENTHGYVLTRNPNLVPDTTTEKDIELLLTRGIVNEGLGVAGAVLTAMASRDPRERAAARAEHHSRLGTVDSWKAKDMTRELEGKHWQILRERFDRTLEGLSLWDKTLEMWGPWKRLAQWKVVDSVLSSDEYQLGYIYVLSNLEKLIDQGLGIGSALNKLIDNPPSSIEEMDVSSFVYSPKRDLGKLILTRAGNQQLGPNIRSKTTIQRNVWV